MSKQILIDYEEYKQLESFKQQVENDKYKNLIKECAKPEFLEDNCYGIYLDTSKFTNKLKDIIEEDSDVKVAWIIVR